MRYYRGEAWLHEALLFSYLPLLDTIHTLRDEHLTTKLTLSFSPILLEQLAQPDVLKRFDEFVTDRISAANADIAYYEGEAFNEHLRYLAIYQRDQFIAMQTFLKERLNGDFVGALRLLQETGMIEIAASAATSAYLPLLKSKTSLDAQVKVGIATYEKYFGQKPTSFVLPDHGYRPGLEDLMERHGIRLVFTEGHSIRGGQPSGAATGEVFGGYGAVRQQYSIADRFNQDARDLSTRYAYTIGNSDVAVLARSHSASFQVWGDVLGYPGDVDYRDFFRKSGTSHLFYWRVTGKNIADQQKDYYHPDWASFKIDQHAENFANMIGDLVRNHQNHRGTPGICMISYPMELFGWRWHEGVAWIGKMLRYISYNPGLQATTATESITLNPPTQAIDLYESSWGAGGRHFNWNNIDNSWMWSVIEDCAARMEELAVRYSNPTADEAATLAQAAREVLLLQSGDWQLLIATGEARMFAIQRFTQHVERFNYFASALEAGSADANAASEFFELDHVFADIDYTWFRP